MQTDDVYLTAVACIITTTTPLPSPPPLECGGLHRLTTPASRAPQRIRRLHIILSSNFHIIHIKVTIPPTLPSSYLLNPSPSPPHPGLEDVRYR